MNKMKSNFSSTAWFNRVTAAFGDLLHRRRRKAISVPPLPQQLLHDKLPYARVANAIMGHTDFPQPPVIPAEVLKSSTPHHPPGLLLYWRMAIRMLV